MKPATEETRAPDAIADTPVGTPAPVANKQLCAALLKRARQDSKLGRLTPVNAVPAAANVGPEEMEATVAELASPKYPDMGLVAHTGTLYLFSTASIKPEQARDLARIDQFRVWLLKKVRENSQLGKPAGVESVRENTVPTPSSDEVQACLADILKDEQCKDIQQLSAYTGALYLYSDTSLSKEEAEKVARIEEFHLKVLKRIREDSKYKSKLTRAETLKTLVPDIQPGELETACAEVTSAYHDIHSLVAKTGVVYLFSEEHMTAEYAQILLRVEAKDPCFLIAEMVREESRVYPRPTNVELFKYGLFDIDLDRLDEHIAQTLEQYHDIKLFRIPDGPTFLYSDQYLTENDARDFVLALKRSQRD